MISPTFSNKEGGNAWYVAGIAGYNKGKISSSSVKEFTDNSSNKTTETTIYGNTTYALVNAIAVGLSGTIDEDCDSSNVELDGNTTIVCEDAKYDVAKQQNRFYQHKVPYRKGKLHLNMKVENGYTWPYIYEGYYSSTPSSASIYKLDDSKLNNNNAWDDGDNKDVDVEFNKSTRYYYITLRIFNNNAVYQRTYGTYTIELE